MSEKILGIHHITAIAGDPQTNLDFCTGVLGLRLVKLTVNFDDPGTYHLYYGDGLGHPGTILTFFPWPHAPQGRRGAGQVTQAAFAIPEPAVDFWAARLAEHQVAFKGPFDRFGERIISLSDPDGLGIELAGAVFLEPRILVAIAPHTFGIDREAFLDCQVTVAPVPGPIDRRVAARLMPRPQACIQPKPLRQLEEAALGAVRSRKHEQAESQLGHAAVGGSEDFRGVLVKGELVQNDVTRVPAGGVGVGGEHDDPRAVPEGDLVLTLLGEWELPIFGEMGGDSFVGVDQAFGLAGQLERLPLRPGQENHRMLRPLKTPLEHRPGRRCRRVADLRGLDRQGQTATVLRPSYLVRAEHRLPRRFPFARLDLDHRCQGTP